MDGENTANLDGMLKDQYEGKKKKMTNTPTIKDPDSTAGWKRILDYVIDGVHARTAHVTKKNEDELNEAAGPEAVAEEPKGWDRLKPKK